jgi:hypothetical protein
MEWTSRQCLPSGRKRDVEQQGRQTDRQTDRHGRRESDRQTAERHGRREERVCVRDREKNYY